ncbi:MAG: tripartite tricarboxylate transporter permease [Candidatus Competibacteraceae bacterium]|nr:tripartite tricarboxylate transporter permease [Candidatus Competibacteraceae bacterium]MCB1804208.1 tripartite tricarboxylate transporter permease [Candidatus Competibacteraceae bacterium]MCB1814656.1 tripartite tricarboxylate transporter permease [Candidatus Competibacteraceae bacterium]
MTDIDFLYGILTYALTLENIGAVAIGILIGCILGAIPGLNGTMAIALLIPLTFTWQPLFSIALLMGCWKGSVYGGSISGILLNTPGTPESAPTALDGYPMTQQGKAGKALKMALVASVIGALFSDLLLFVAAPPISSLALKFGPPELSMLILLSLVIVAGTGSDTHVKGLIATVLGLLIATIGLDPMTAQRRFTFDILELDSGLDLLAMLIGLLVMSEVLLQIDQGMLRKENTDKAQQTPADKQDSRLSWLDFKSCIGVIFRSSMIGSFCGALPGVGSVTAAFLGYDQARLTAKDKSRFGKGDIRGVAAPEAANNAVCGTALIPLLTLGIPGSLSVAIIMGAFIIHGIAPGPMLMVENPQLAYGLFALLLLSDIFLFLIPLPLLVVAQWVIRTPKNYLFPIILIFCMLGAYSTHQSLFDVSVMVLFGILGYAMKKMGISVAALLIAFILGPMLETYCRQSLTMSRGDPAIFLNSGLSATLFALAVLVLIWSLARGGKALFRKELP